MDSAVCVLRNAKASVAEDEPARWVESEIDRIRGRGEGISRECTWGRYHRPREEPCPNDTVGCVAGFKRPPKDKPLTGSAIFKACGDHLAPIKEDLVAQGYETEIHRLARRDIDDPPARPDDQPRER